jgi:hypothetical protein
MDANEALKKATGSYGGLPTLNPISTHVNNKHPHYGII